MDFAATSGARGSAEYVAGMGRWEILTGYWLAVLKEEVAWGVLLYLIGSGQARMANRIGPSIKEGNLSARQAIIVSTRRTVLCKFNILFWQECHKAQSSF